MKPRDPEIAIHRPQSLPLFEQAHARRTDPQTSKAVAAKIVNIGPVREKILHVLGNCPRTDEQIAERYFFCVEKFGWPKCSPSGLRSRRAELVTLGFVEDSGERGKTAMGNDAIVWKVAGRPAGETK